MLISRKNSLCVSRVVRIPLCYLNDRRPALSAGHILSIVNYQNKKATVRSHVVSEFGSPLRLEVIFSELITEKIMSGEFNETFYRGEGETTRNSSGESKKMSSKNRVDGIFRGLGVFALAIVKMAQSRHNLEPLKSIGWVYSIPSQYIATTRAITELEKFLDLTLTRCGTEPPAKYFVQSGNMKNPQGTARVEVVPYLSAKILSLDNQAKLKTSLRLVRRTINWLRISIKHPNILLIGPEFILDLPAIENRINKIGDVLITTQSQLLAPALVFKSSLKAERVMYWYSDNSMQITKREEDRLDYTYLSQPQISKHLVWTSSWAKTLKSYNPDAHIFPIGPIIFNTLEINFRQTSQEPKSFYTVTIFDVTPKEMASPESIYSAEVMMTFLRDIIASISKRHPTANINLKPKRRYSHLDSREYLDFIELQSPRLNVLDWNCDIIGVIEASDLVICIPFTSPGIISSHLGVQTAFYLPSTEYNLDSAYEGIPVIQDREGLDSFLEKLRPNSF